MSKKIFSLLLLGVASSSFAMQEQPHHVVLYPEQLRYATILNRLRSFVENVQADEFKREESQLCELPLHELENLYSLALAQEKIVNALVAHHVTPPVLSQIDELMHNMDEEQKKPYRPGTPPNWDKFLTKESKKYDIEPERRYAIEILKEVPYKSCMYNFLNSMMPRLMGLPEDKWAELFGATRTKSSIIQNAITAEIDKYEKFWITDGNRVGYRLVKKRTGRCAIM